MVITKTNLGQIHISTAFMNDCRTQDFVMKILCGKPEKLFLMVNVATPTTFLIKMADCCQVAMGRRTGTTQMNMLIHIIKITFKSGENAMLTIVAKGEWPALLNVRKEPLSI